MRITEDQIDLIYDARCDGDPAGEAVIIDGKKAIEPCGNTLWLVRPVEEYWRSRRGIERPVCAEYCCPACGQKGSFGPDDPASFVANATIRRVILPLPERTVVWDASTSTLTIDEIDEWRRADFEAHQEARYAAIEQRGRSTKEA